MNWTIGIIALGLIILILFGTGILNWPFALSSNAVEIKATDIRGTYVEWTVTHSDYLNMKIDQGCATVKINGDSDLQTTQALCDLWKGQYSASQGTCDINTVYLPVNGIVNNNLAFRNGNPDIQPGSRTIICINPTLAGCTSTQVANDQCTGQVTGSFVIKPPAIICGDGTCDATETPSSCPQDCTVAPYCGDGTCDSGETQSTCPSDCGSPSPPPAADPITALINWISGLLGGFLAWIRSLFGI